LVELTYRPCFSQVEYIKAFEDASNNTGYDFVEGIVYSQDKAVIMTGKMVPYTALKKNIFGYNPIGFWFKSWFYKHVETFLNKKSISGASDENIPLDYVEFIPLRDYFHRHTRSIFWVYIFLISRN
jgi:delta24-sterol reductase